MLRYKINKISQVSSEKLSIFYKEVYKKRNYVKIKYDNLVLRSNKYKIDFKNFALYLNYNDNTRLF